MIIVLSFASLRGTHRENAIKKRTGKRSRFRSARMMKQLRVNNNEMFSLAYWESHIEHE